MTSNQFYIPRLDPGAVRIVMDGDEHHHLSRVARIRLGETVRLFDGGGLACLARVESVGPERTTLTVLHHENGEDGRIFLTLALGIMSSKKMEFVLQKGAELGISEFIPLETGRSLRAQRGRSSSRIERWERIAREAVKQSKGTIIPAVLTPSSLPRFFEESRDARKFLMSERGGRPFKDFLRKDPGAENGLPVRVLLAVGPEGGWTEGEEGDFRSHGFETVSLGRRMLKTETAALAAAAMVIHFWSR